ncbi:MAG: PH domain-containing protein [Planctomycetota bacterium]
MRYSHTQYAPVHYMVLAATVLLLPLAWLNREEPGVVILVTGVLAVIVLVALMFHSMTVSDEGEWLAIRYGPLPVFRKQIPYEAITAVEPGRTSVIDGWGIHWIPGRGTTYNVWGFDCVNLTLGDRVIRVGSDDVENLAAFLTDKLDGTKEEPL